MATIKHSVGATHALSASSQQRRDTVVIQHFPHCALPTDGMLLRRAILIPPYFFAIRKSMTYDKQMKLISWNTNGLRATHKNGQFLPFIKKEKPDVLCLQEIKACANFRVF